MIKKNCLSTKNTAEKKNIETNERIYYYFSVMSTKSQIQTFHFIQSEFFFILLYRWVYVCVCVCGLSLFSFGNFVVSREKKKRMDLFLWPANDFGYGAFFLEKTRFCSTYFLLWYDHHNISIQSDKLIKMGFRFCLLYCMLFSNAYRFFCFILQDFILFFIDQVSYFFFS